MNHKAQPELVTRSARVIRQVIMRHVDPFYPAVGNAIFYLFDWNNYRYQLDSVKAKINQRYAELQSKFNDAVNKSYNEGLSYEDSRRKALMPIFYDNSSLTEQKMFIVTRLNTFRKLTVEGNVFISY